MARYVMPKMAMDITCPGVRKHLGYVKDDVCNEEKNGMHVNVQDQTLFWCNMKNKVREKMTSPVPLIGGRIEYRA